MDQIKKSISIKNIWITWNISTLDHPKTSDIKGLPEFMIAQSQESPLDYRYWKNYTNELVDRLRLLVAERSAGNNNYDNEIFAIIEELREAKVIF